MTPKETFDKVCEIAKNNQDILGVVLLGSRGKGFETPDSDYDLTVIAVDGKGEEVESLLAGFQITDIDLNVHELSNFRSYAAWGTADAWDRYDFLHVKIFEDKTNGELEKICYEKGHIPVEYKDEYVRGQTDMYLDNFFRSVKSCKKGNEFGQHLRAVQSIAPLVNIVFALNDRQAPFLDYLALELKRYPLAQAPWSEDVFCASIQKIISTGDLVTQQKMAKDLEVFLRQQGFGDTLDAWEGKDVQAIDYT